MSRGPGRPPLDEDARRTTRRVTRVTQAEAERIDAAAEAAGMSVSDWLRWWAMQGLGVVEQLDRTGVVEDVAAETLTAMREGGARAVAPLLAEQDARLMAAIVGDED